MRMGEGRINMACTMSLRTPHCASVAVGSRLGPGNRNDLKETLISRQIWGFAPLLQEAAEGSDEAPRPSLVDASQRSSLERNAVHTPSPSSAQCAQCMSGRIKLQCWMDENTSSKRTDSAHEDFPASFLTNRRAADACSRWRKETVW